MGAKVLLYVSANHATAALWRRGDFVQVHRFSSDQDGWSECGSFLLAQRTTPLYVLADAVEEDYRTETLPHAWGSGQQQMVARKLRQIYRNTPYRAAELQGREGDKRRDDRYLFTAITNPDLLRPWLEIVQTQQIPLAGIYLLPMVTQSLVARLAPGIPKLLLVSDQSGGLRQSFFHNGKLRVSRLTAFDRVDNPTTMSAYAAEIGKTQLYLSSLRLIGLEENLPVYVVDRDGRLSGLCQTLAADNSVACTRIGVQEVVKRLGMSSTAAAAFPDSLHLTMLAKQPPRTSLAPPPILRAYRYHQARSAIYALSAATLATTLAWSGVNLHLQEGYKNDAIRLTAEARQQEALYLQAARHFPPTPAAAADMEQTVQVAQQIQKIRRGPKAMMDAVSQALDANPSVTLERFRWRAGVAADKTPVPGIPAPAAPRSESAEVEAEIRPFLGDYRAAVKAIDMFADTLRKMPGVSQVEIAQLPLNINPDAALAGSTREGGKSGATARFTLRVVMGTKS